MISKPSAPAPPISRSALRHPSLSPLEPVLRPGTLSNPECCMQETEGLPLGGSFEDDVEETPIAAGGRRKCGDTMPGIWRVLEQETVVVDDVSCLAGREIPEIRVHRLGL